MKLKLNPDIPSTPVETRIGNPAHIVFTGNGRILGVYLENGIHWVSSWYHPDGCWLDDGVKTGIDLVNTVKGEE